MTRRRLLLLLAIIGLAVGGGGAFGYSNGELPDSALAPINGSNARLAKGAAASWNTMRLCALKSGVDIGTGGDGAYRSIAQQRQRYAEYQNGTGNLAAYPGTSTHGAGRAIDLDGTRMRAWIDQHGGAYGWYWGEAPSEWWHITGKDTFPRPDPGPNSQFPTLRHGSGGACQQPFVDEARKRLGMAQGRPFTVGMEGTVKGFQKANGLKADGVIGQGTWNKIRSKARGPNPAPQPHASGADVKVIQGLLNARLHEYGSKTQVPVTGEFGPITTAAMKEYQRWAHLPQSGQADAATSKKLRISVAKPQHKVTVAESGDKGQAKVAARGPYYLLDVSEHNGDVDWKAVRKSGAEGVIIRATWAGNTVGGLHDDNLLTNQRCSEARAAGLKVGFYSYDVPAPGKTPEQAAGYFTGKVWNQAACRWRVGDFLPAHDMEESLLGKKESADWDRRWHVKTRANLAHAGLKCDHAVSCSIEYGGSYVRELGLDSNFAAPLWLPAYGNDDGKGVPNYWLKQFTPTPWTKRGWGIAIYQYWSRSRVSGIAGDVDRNVIRSPDYWLPKLIVK